MDFERPITDYATQLQGTAWDTVSFRNAMNMAAGLDIEESFANLSNPDSFIAQFFSAIMTGTGTDWIDVMRAAEPLVDEAPGTHMRYSTSITQALALAIENVAGITYAATFVKHIWSKIGVNDPFFIPLLSEGTALGGGGNFTAIEDFLRYAHRLGPTDDARPLDRRHSVLGRDLAADNRSSLGRPVASSYQPRQRTGKRPGADRRAAPKTLKIRHHRLKNASGAVRSSIAGKPSENFPTQSPNDIRSAQDQDTNTARCPAR
ncbi:serine hydrolase domain-containing protein [Tropicimonas sp. IMCC6043]|uniref:serine hydrolase n=1 Tax=Tropicimonas sp. IMCC6043 TaxID=2510645 RepID=UPI00101D3B1B|nr:serine hydrolase domain-containing protein [Tropicimonas sp. IMCC6043]RYH05897.1 class A beta-lactamase-related serine hydrolase [Tropicimonas sp. IMCC6043]